MNEDSLITFDNLRYYDQKMKAKVSGQLQEKVDKYDYNSHNHDLSACRADLLHTTSTVVDNARTAGFRKCKTVTSANGTVEIDTNVYDMAYLTLSGTVTITLLDTEFDGARADNFYRGSLARHIKIIIKNPTAGSINWPESVVWINDETPTYTSGSNKVDVIDLFTPDGEVWFANIMKSWTLN